ncbi:hypothetical protein WKH08_18765 [Pantoea agglomerans]|uniref:hypothetical protein n=1 Tax=Enterobacter agglomerans TaxID=549 RepID=UPI003C7B3D81
MIKVVNYQRFLLPADKVDIDFYTLQLKRLAARYQSGENLKVITENVKALIKAFENKLGDDCDYQVASWVELSWKLTPLVRKTSDPKWANIISYAVKRVNAKKNTALYRRKRCNG